MRHPLPFLSEVIENFSGDLPALTWGTGPSVHFITRTEQTFCSLRSGGKQHDYGTTRSLTQGAITYAVTSRKKGLKHLGWCQVHLIKNKILIFGSSLRVLGFDR
jgi:hypothetical protein